MMSHLLFQCISATIKTLVKINLKRIKMLLFKLFGLFYPIECLDYHASNAYIEGLYHKETIVLAELQKYINSFKQDYIDGLGDEGNWITIVKGGVVTERR